MSPDVAKLISFAAKRNLVLEVSDACLYLSAKRTLADPAKSAAHAACKVVVNNFHQWFQRGTGERSISFFEIDVPSYPDLSYDAKLTRDEFRHLTDSYGHFRE